MIKAVLAAGALLLGTVNRGSLVTETTATAGSALPREVTIVGLDYAFQAPRELPAGPTTFRFDNKGKVRHEFNIALLKPGAKIDDLIALRKQGKSTLSLLEGPVGVLFAAPGGRSSVGLTTDLIPGRDYAVICIFRDTATAPRHLEMGMYSVIHVAPGVSATNSGDIPTHFITGLDYAFKAPATIPSGRRWLAFENQGKVAHEVAIALLRQGVTIDSVLKVEKAGGEVDGMFEPGESGLLHSQAGQKALGRLDVDFLPGRVYSIVCFFQDSAKAPPHVALGMVGSIQVNGVAADR